MTELLRAEHIYKSFKAEEVHSNYVLENVNLAINDGEIVALLGKSGSGKSTLLRILCGLIQPTKGEVFYRDELIQGPAKGISMVFQSFALLPWLNVLQNVELGLEALGIPREERRKRAIRAIDIIGMDGFESAYPKELSGGMRQRVGFARALVVNPDILIMDEPFSALDVLTAENLKSDLLDLWHEKKTNTNGMLLVTHSIEEAVMLANRILIFGTNPGRIRAEMKVDLPYPRNIQSPEFIRLVDKIYTLITTVADQRIPRAIQARQLGIGYRLPDVAPAELSGLIETIDTEFDADASIDLPKLADTLMMDIDDLFSITEALEIMGFAYVSHGDIRLTPIGKSFVEADLQGRKKLFAQQLISHIPLAQYIRKVLDDKRSHSVSEERFLSKLEDYLSEKESERVLRTAIDWGRYAELFAYDYDSGLLSLENPD